MEGRDLGLDYVVEEIVIKVSSSNAANKKRKHNNSDDSLGETHGVDPVDL